MSADSAAARGSASGREIVVLGVSGSPRVGGATSRLVRSALLGAGEVPGTRTEFELKVSGRTVRAKEIAWMYGRKIATVTAIIRAGLDASGLDLPDTPYGFELPDFPAALAAIGADEPASAIDRPAR